MRHKKRGRILHRKKDQRKALLKSLFVSLLKYKKIKTTEAKAKELKKIADRLIYRARNKTLHNIRLVRKFLNKDQTKKLFKIAENYKKRVSGYTRIVHLPIQRKDNAKMVLIELVEPDKNLISKTKTNKNEKQKNKQKPKTRKNSTKNKAKTKNTK